MDTEKGSVIAKGSGGEREGRMEGGREHCSSGSWPLTNLVLLLNYFLVAQAVKHLPTMREIWV